jgi:hypothetical protein
MKTNLILLFAMSLFISSCQKDEVIPQDTCLLSSIDRGNGNKHTYTYDANNRVSIMAREFDGNGSGKISKFLYIFTYDAAGLLIKSTWTLDGAKDGEETYSYANGKVTKVTFTYANGSKGVNNIKYDGSSNMVEFSIEPEDKSYHDLQYFEYDSNNIMIKRGIKDAISGDIYFESKNKIVNIAKSPEQYLKSKGLPFDVLTGMPWSINWGGEGSSSETFFMDEKGALVSDGIELIGPVKTNAKGFVTEITYINADKTTQKSTFAFINCN